MIELANESDVEAIAALNVEAFSEFADRLSQDGWRGMQARVSDVASRAAFSQFFIVRRQRAIVGSIGYCPPGKDSSDIFPADWSAIFLLAVARSHRGQGVARELVSHCILRARDDAAPALGLFTSELMTAAQHLYESMGFRRDGELPLKYGLQYWRYRLDLL